MNVHGFITAIEHQTDTTASTSMDWIPVHYIFGIYMNESAEANSSINIKIYRECRDSGRT
jgi:hypothetical protein